MTKFVAERIAVVGAGLMGRGIAQIFAAHGHHVFLQDISRETLANAPQTISQICDLLGSEEGTLDRVTYTDDLVEASETADVIIEAVAEKLDVKRQVFAMLDRHAPASAILASNSSAIPISQIALAVTDKRRVMGAHFWNPPYVVPLVEVVMAAETGTSERDHLIAILTAVGQEPVLVKRDIPGFIGNRLQHAMKREAIALVASGICDAETVDRVIKLGFGARLAVLGTLEQSDLVGVELTLDIHRVLMPDLDTTSGPHPYLLQLVEAGHLGMKAGRGFYKWTDERAEEVRNRLQTFLARQVKERRLALRATSQTDVN